MAIAALTHLTMTANNPLFFLLSTKPKEILHYRECDHAPQEVITSVYLKAGLSET